MHKQIVINSTSNEVRVALLEDQEVVEFSMERADRRRVVGNVYKGKVSAVRPGLQAAFVEIGMDKAGFLHVSDLIHDNPEGDGGRGRRRPRRESLRPIESMLKEGDEILVQVTKDVIGTKGPRLTADISLPGRFMVMMPKGDHVGVSRKIEERSERHRLRDLLSSLKKSEEGGAFIIRTAAVGIEKKMLERDMDYLRNLWTELQEKAHSMPAPALVHQDVGLIVGMVRDIFKDDIDSLLIDSKQDYQELMQYVKTFVPELRDRIRYYDGDIPIFDRFGIEAELKKSLDRKVWMKRGGFLVIDQTEALVAVDVNTGRFTGKKNQAETILKTNLMAAKEVARQVRLRDIGGIIVIDFIDMDSEDHKRRVLTELRSHLKRDRSRNKTFGISELGLVEMSRQRVQESLKDRLSDDCPFCHGSGQVLSADTLANKVELLLAKLTATRNEKGIQVRANPTLALMLMTERANALQQLARESGMAIDVVDDPRLHREEFQILSVERNRDLVAEMEKSSGGRGDRDRGRDSGRERSRGRGRGRGDAERDSSRERSREPVAEKESSSRSSGDRRGGDRPDAREESTRSRRGRRGGRGRRTQRGGEAGTVEARQDSRAESRAESRGDRTAPTPSPSAGEPSQWTQEASGDANESRGGRRRTRRRGRRGRGNVEVQPTPESPSTASAPPDERPAEAVSEERSPEQRADENRGGDGERSPRTRRRGRRGRRGRGESAPTDHPTGEAMAEETKGAAPSSPSTADNDSDREERPRARRGRESGPRDSRGRREDGRSRRLRRDRSEEDAVVRPTSPAVASPDDYVRPVPASSARSESQPPAAEANARPEASAESPTPSSTESDSPRQPSPDAESGSAPRRRRRRVRRTGVPTRVIGTEREENGS